MNILMIDDTLLPEKFGADSTQKALFRRLLAENYRRRIFLARRLSELGANVLLARLDFTSMEPPSALEYRESDGISHVFVHVKAGKKPGISLSVRELLHFNAVLSDNSAGLAGLFRPDVVVAAGVLPFCVSAAAKIAESANAVLITELSCSPKELLPKLGFLSQISPVLVLLKRSVETAFRQSDAVLGFFPSAAQKFSDAHNLYPLLHPAPFEPEKPSDEAKKQRDILSAFGEGKTFVLVYCGELENGCSIEELILSAGTFGDKFALVFLSEGTKKPFFKRFVSEKGITNVFFTEGADEKDFPFILSAADGIFLSESDYIKGLASDYERFFTAFLAGKPVIAASEHCSDFFRKSGGAIITKPRHKESIRLGIKTLLSMTETDRETLGRANKSFAEQNSPENFAENYFSLIDNLVKQKENKK